MNQMVKKIRFEFSTTLNLGSILRFVGLSVEQSTKPKCQLKLRPDLDGSTSGNIGTLPDGKDYSKFWNVSKLGFNSAVFLMIKGDVISLKKVKTKTRGNL